MNDRFIHKDTLWNLGTIQLPIGKPQIRVLIYHKKLLADTIHCLEAWIDGIHQWMKNNFLKLKADKI